MRATATEAATWTSMTTLWWSSRDGPVGACVALTWTTQICRQRAKVSHTGHRAIQIPRAVVAMLGARPDLARRVAPPRAARSGRGGRGGRGGGRAGESIGQRAVPALFHVKRRGDGVLHRRTARCPRFSKCAQPGAWSGVPPSRTPVAELPFNREANAAVSRETTTRCGQCRAAVPHAITMPRSDRIE